MSDDEGSSGEGEGSSRKPRDVPIKEVLWPPNGYLFKETSLCPVFCKPKLIPLKSLTLDKLERMQKESLEKLKQMREAEKAKEAEEKQSATVHTDIWNADESTPRNE